ncbi:helix-turn-helix transcriptional regulator [Vibrio sp. SCSIO 43137]|uniref:helix-turn-helix transcriptional regulator n=1 Tax=Vibrio sp. SCSIO 43137 TaxID=3021011 RepID=UPI002307B373|nr:PAS domain-containing protein [Vibrio sp. SCSIO 43137]WCE32042.1 PAS domain-containing protein [Vibrio sp. SCSIO 43137]
MTPAAYSSLHLDFTDKDRVHLESNFRLAETIAEFIGPHCEVVIYSLENLKHSVVKIVNSQNTKQEVGSPITDAGLRILDSFAKKGDVATENHFTTAEDGSLFKSTSCVLTGENHKPIGLLCINMNLSHPFPEIIKTLMPDITDTHLKIHKQLSSSPASIIKDAIESAVVEVESDATINLKGKNKAITKVLFDKGIFEFKEATAIVSEQLGITRHAIYKYNREFKS